MQGSVRSAEANVEAARVQLQQSEDSLGVAQAGESAAVVSLQQLEEQKANTLASFPAIKNAERRQAATLVKVQSLAPGANIDEDVDAALNDKEIALEGLELYSK
eukprot:528778-Pyramimonas_sp.AAC.1